MSEPVTGDGIGDPVDHVATYIAWWRAHVPDAAGRGDGIAAAEDLLRGEAAVLQEAGLDGDEAFLIALRRHAAADHSSRSFAEAYVARLWPRAGEAPAARAEAQMSVSDAVLFAVCASLVVLVARVVAAWMGADEAWFLQNSPWLVVPVVASWFVRRRQVGARALAPVLGVCAVAAVVLNAYPYVGGSSTEVLTTVHLPLLLWAALAVPFAGGWSLIAERGMDFVRFTGEWFVYYVLIALGGGVLLGLTGAVLVPVGVAIDAVASWVVPLGAAGAVVIAAWLVEREPRVAGGIAPVLTMLFTPLFALMLAIAAVLYSVRGVDQSFDREMLGVFDALLVVVLGLVLYSASARPPGAAPGWFDRVQFVALIAAVVLDALVLASMVTRISDLGLTPNRAAALGLNVLLLTALAGGAWHSVRFLRGGGAAPRLGQWLVGFLPVLAAWAAIVAVVLPIAFSFE